MKLADHLTDEQKKQLRVKSPKNKKRNKEKLTTKDIEELMGMNRDRYERRNGAWRRKWKL
jgi:hypothetical protein